MSEFRFNEVVPFGDPRGLDPSSVYLTAAAARAIGDAGVSIRGDARDRSGLFVGSNVLSHYVGDSLTVSTYARGIEHISASTFTRIVLNAPAGACATILALKGPTTTIATGDGSGAFAIAQGAEYMCRRSEVDAIVAGGVDEIDRGIWGLNPTHAAQKQAAKPPAFANYDTEGVEGAACLLLAAAPSPLARGRGGIQVGLSGWSYAGPGNLKAAVEEALEMAGISLGQVDGVFGIDKTGQWSPIAAAAGIETCAVNHSDVLGYATSTSAVVAAVQAFLAVRRGETCRALVISAAGSAATTALVFTKEAGEVQ
jgi:3-oxoacyl-(acyl-carrier-protein) synthase